MKADPSAEISGLGNLVKEYPMSRARMREIFLLMLFSAGMSMVCFLAVIFTEDPSPAGMRNRIGVSILGLFVGLPALVGIRQLLVLRASSLSLYENGLIYRAHGQAASTRWDEIYSYMQETACRITKKDGQVIEFGANILEADEAIERIRAQTVRHILPEMKAILRAGGSLQFEGLKPFPDWFLGKWLNRFSYATSGLWVDGLGIRLLDGDAAIAWTDITDYGLGQARMGRWPVSVFFIQSKAGRLQTRAGLLGNSHLLLDLCAWMTRTSAAGQGSA